MSDQKTEELGKTEKNPTSKDDKKQQKPRRRSQFRGYANPVEDK